MKRRVKKMAQEIRKPVKNVLTVTLLATYSTGSSILVRCEVLMAVNLNSSIFWDVILCSLEEHCFTLKVETAVPLKNVGTLSTKLQGVTSVCIIYFFMFNNLLNQTIMVL
jgi:hypothetical protein